MKTCTKCNQEKSFEDFSKNKQSKDGRHTQCKQCRNKDTRATYWEDPEKERQRNREKYARDPDYLKNWRRKNPDKVREYHRRYDEKNPEAHVLRTQKYNAKKRGALTPEELDVSFEYRKAILKDPCFYCGSTTAESYHVDHKFPISKGGDDRWYNLVRACETCNLRKSNKCSTMFLLMGDDLRM